MKTKALYTIYLVGLAAAATLAAGCSAYKARREMDEGKKLYREGNYPAAAEHFNSAAAADDNLVAAKLNLAAVYRLQYELEEAATPAKARFGQQAIDVYQKVLEKDPRNMVALKGLGCAAMHLRRFDQALDLRKKVLSLSPNDPESYFWVGAVDWSAVDEDIRAQKGKIGMDPDAPFRGDQNDKQVCDQARSANAARVAEGITMLQTALDKRPDYDDVMVFMALLLRQKADLQCGDLKAWDEYRSVADQWIDKSIAARKPDILNASKPSEPGKDSVDRKSDIVWQGCPEPIPPPPTQAAQQGPG